MVLLQLGATSTTTIVQASYFIFSEKKLTDTITPMSCRVVLIQGLGSEACGPDIDQA